MIKVASDLAFSHRLREGFRPQGRIDRYDNNMLILRTRIKMQKLSRVVFLSFFPFLGYAFPASCERFFLCLCSTRLQTEINEDPATFTLKSSENDGRSVLFRLTPQGFSS